MKCCFYLVSGSLCYSSSLLCLQSERVFSDSKKTIRQTSFFISISLENTEKEAMNLRGRNGSETWMGGKEREKWCDSNLVKIKII